MLQTLYLTHVRCTLFQSIDGSRGGHVGQSHFRLSFFWVALALALLSTGCTMKRKHPGARAGNPGTESTLPTANTADITVGRHFNAHFESQNENDCQFVDDEGGADALDVVIGSDPLVTDA